MTLIWQKGVLILMTGKDRRIKLAEPVLGDEEIHAIQEVFKSGWIAEGPITKEFEAKVAEFTGAKNVIATTSCTTALELALRAIKIGRGDEVIVPDFTYPATADVVKWIGAKPVLVDVDSSYNINPEEIEKAISKKTKCLIPVSWGGNPLDFKPLNALKEKYGFYIVEDAACSLGSEFSGKKTGSWADITCFSFHARKVITTGEGGMITTDSDSIAEEIRCLKRFGIKMGKHGEEFVKVGTNYKLCDILSAIGVQQMKRLTKIINRHIELADNYSKLFENIDYVKPPTKEKEAKHVFQTYAVYIELEGIRDKIIKDLRKDNIETQIGTYALHLLKPFRHNKKIGKLQVAEKLYKNLLALPMYYSLTFDEQEQVVEGICKLVNGYSENLT
jgi:dTDP-4-amino-4,6-dideoxygalactose transaminase